MVYRVETGDTLEGPYSTDHCTVWHEHDYAECSNCKRNSYSWVLQDLHNDEDHPGPADDLSAEDFHRFTSDHRFGFASQDQCLTWFAAEWDDLAALGYVIRVFEVPADAVLFGGNQVAFDYEAASIRDTWRM